MKVGRFIATGACDGFGRGGKMPYFGVRPSVMRATPCGVEEADAAAESAGGATAVSVGVLASTDGSGGPDGAAVGAGGTDGGGATDGAGATAPSWGGAPLLFATEGAVARRRRRPSGGGGGGCGTSSAEGGAVASIWVSASTCTTLLALRWQPRCAGPLPPPPSLLPPNAPDSHMPNELAHVRVHYEHDVSYLRRPPWGAPVA